MRASALVLSFLGLVLAACANGGSGGAGPSSDDGGDDSAAVDATKTDAHPASDGGDSGSMTSATKACGDNASAYCAQLEMCASFLLTVQYGDKLTCVARNTAACADILAAPGSGWTGDVLEACVTARTALDCATFLHGKPAPNACRVTGQVITSDPCRYDGQCGSGYCRYASGASCGNCVTLGATGAPCTSSADCDGNLVCTAGASGTCQPPSSVGGACSATSPCQQGLVCLAATCAQPGALGAACDPKNNGVDCDYDQGVYCDGTAKACKAYVVALAGGACGGTSSTVCSGAGTCYQSACVPPAQDGSACAPTMGIGCLYPSTCQNATCGLYAASMCK